MSEYTITQINLEIDRLQETFDQLEKTDFAVFPANQILCMILISTIATLKSSIVYEEKMDLITSGNIELPFSILETA